MSTRCAVETSDLIVAVGCGQWDRLGPAFSRLEHETHRVDSIEHLLDADSSLQPDLVILGTGVRGNRVRLLSSLSTSMPRAKTILMFDQPDEAELLAALHAGASGYLPNDEVPDRFSDAINAVLAGDTEVPRSMISVLVRQLFGQGHISIQRDGDQLLEVSQREWEVLCLLREGFSTQEIADRLFVSAATIRSHLSSLMHELDVHDRDTLLIRVFME